MLLHHALQYKSWADRRTLDAVAQIDQHCFPDAIAFARQQLNHMVRVEELFRARLLALDEPHQSTNSAELPSLAELDHRLTRSNEWLQNYLHALTADALHEAVRFKFVDRKRGMLTREEAIFHLVNHGTYHRGAIGHALDLAQTQRPADTYTVFIHTAEPQRREP
ncbi:DinB family protein [Vogesella indigofera]|uniref:DinB family protein n=1 Tax=Vogesella indigofera TaxID=45465 RepID=UPI0035AFC0BB